MEILTEYFKRTQQFQLIPFDFKTYKGVWRNVCLYLTTDGLLSVTIVYRPEDLSERKLEVMNESVLRFFTEGKGRECGAASVYLQNEATLQGNLITGEEILYTKVRLIYDG